MTKPSFACWACFDMGHTQSYDSSDSRPCPCGASREQRQDRTMTKPITDSVAGMRIIEVEEAVLVRLLDAALDVGRPDASLDAATDRASELIWVKPRSQTGWSADDAELLRKWSEG